MPSAQSASAPRPALVMLLLVYTFNFLDRQILSILAAPVQRDLGLDDAQLGMLGGLAFAALYSTLAIPLALLADRTSRSWPIAFALFLAPQVLVYVWLAPVLTAVQHLVPAYVRATASASFLLINNLIGLGLGSWAIGGLSKALAPAYGSEALRYALAAGLCLYLVAGALMALASRRLARDWVA